MAYIDNGIIWAKCPRCGWRAEAEDLEDAQRAEMFHWDDEHDDTRRI